MKRILPLTFLLLFLGFSWFFLSSTTDGVFGVYYSGGPANSGLDRTGGPFSSGQTCSACHSGGAGPTTISFSLLDGNNVAVTSYTAGASYTAQWIVSGPAVIKGFQGVALKSNNTQAGSFTTVLSTQSVISPLGGRQYPEHQGSSGSGVFSFTWVAPVSGSGNITFYACGNGVNGNGGTSGDAPSSPIAIVISEVVPTVINYGGTTVCNNGFNLTPTITGIQGGTFSASPAGLSLNVSTGQLNLAASSPGSYTITYTYAGGTATKPMTVKPTYNISNTATICSSDSIFLAGAWQNTAGTYTSNLLTIGNCDSIVTTTLTVNQGPTASYSASICQGDMINLGGTLYSTAGTYTYTATSAGACDSVITTTLTVNPTYNNSISETICQGESTFFGGVSIFAAGTYTNNGTTILGCDSTTVLTLTVTPVNVGVTNSSPTLISQATGAAYQWLDCGNGNTPIAGATSQSYTATANGTYAVKVTSGNCTDTSACETVANVGLQEFILGEVKLYPNPSEGNLNLLFNQAINAKLAVYDLNGKILFSDNIDGKQEYSNSFELAPGTYMIQLSNSEGSTQLIWVVK